MIVWKTWRSMAHNLQSMAADVRRDNNNNKKKKREREKEEKKKEEK